MPGAPLALEAWAGLRVRDASPVAPSRLELDGTSGADCREYVEAVSPGAGEWRLIDRSLLVERRPLASDLYVCPQRAEWTPGALSSAAISRPESSATHGNPMAAA